MIKTVLWDFDGVILDSMAVRDWGFKEIFKNYSDTQVSDLITYHRINGGLSRYVKIRYFYEEILNTTITETQVAEYADNFSVLMKQKLTDTNHLIDDTVAFIKQNYKTYNFHIVSGSDQKELRFLCEQLGVANFFKSIHGSPTPKTTLVETLIQQHGYHIKNTCLIGDSVNDYDAAASNNIAFYGFNNLDLEPTSDRYIHNFYDFKLNS